MKNWNKLAILGAVLAVSASYASATTIFGQLSISGTDTYTANTISFDTGPTTIGGAVTGTFNPTFTDGTAVTMTDFATDGTFVPTTVFSVTESGVTLTYFLQTLTTTFSNAGVPSAYPGDLTLLGTGYFTETGYGNATANFNLTSQFGSTGGTQVTFSETSYAEPSAAPEPSGLVLLGTGLMGTAGLLFRKRKSV
jgi:hypothetical protein